MCVLSATDYMGNKFQLILIIISPSVGISCIILLQLLDTLLAVYVLAFVVIEGFELTLVITRISSNMLPA